jgi:hypothetical protein
MVSRLHIKQFFYFPAGIFFPVATEEIEGDNFKEIYNGDSWGVPRSHIQPHASYFNLDGLNVLF